MPITLNNMGISTLIAEVACEAKLSVWKVMLPDWREVGWPVHYVVDS